MSGLQRRIMTILRRNVARSDRELAALTGVPVAALRLSLFDLYRRGCVDFVRDYVVLGPEADARERAA